MSIFLLTNNQGKSQQSASYLNALYNSPSASYALDNFHLIVNDCHRKIPHATHHTEVSDVFGFGTFFNQEGFGKNAYTKDTIASLLAPEKQTLYLYGHYLFITRKDKTISVLTDPVGLMNVFYAEENGTLYISNNLLVITRLLENKTFAEEGVQDFILQESDIGKCTLFENVERLPVGKKIHIANDALHVENAHDYTIARLDFNQLCQNIQDYFKLIHKYHGKIACELSAGFDTRLVAACAADCIPDLHLVTNDNPSDMGADVAIAKNFAEFCGLPHTIIERDKNTSPDASFEKLAVATNAGRDLIRSSSTLEIAEKKYENFSLILGGYGGEVMRAKYTGYSNLKDFSTRYFAGSRQLRTLNIEENFLKRVQERITEEYLCKNTETNTELFNWIYALSKMRIWGGNRFSMMSTYGDSLHPFMDWHLLSPLIGWNHLPEDKTRLQKAIIEHFKSGAMQFPINPEKQVSRYMKSRFFRRVKGRKDHTVNIIITHLPPTRRTKHIYERINSKELRKRLTQDCNIDLKQLKKLGKMNYITRYASLFILKDILAK